MAAIYNERHISESESTSVYRDDGSVQRVTCYSDIYISEEIPVDDEDINLTVAIDVAKAKDDKCLVSGWANVAVNADGSLPLDWQDVMIRSEVLEKAAIKFMMDYRASGVMHEGESKGVVVESIVFTKEKQACIGIPEGTVPEGWFITVKVLDPDVFAKVKNGTFKMFSIQGNAKRIKL